MPNNLLDINHVLGTTPMSSTGKKGISNSYEPQVGDTVTMNPNCTNDFDGNSLTVYDGEEYQIDSIKGDRVVLTQDGEIYAAVNKKDIIQSSNIVTVNGKNPVTNDPDTDKTTGEGIPLESYIFYDPWVNREHDSNGGHTGYNAGDLNEAIILQRSVAIFMEIYSGKSKITDDIQKEMNEKIHLVPLSDLKIGDFPSETDDKGVIPENYDPLKINATPGINGTAPGFSNYWNSNLSGKNIRVVAISTHGAPTGFALCHNHSPLFDTTDTLKLNSIKVDYILLLGCQLGNTEAGKTFAGALSQKITESNLEDIGKGPENTAIIAANSNTGTGSVSADIGDGLFGLFNRESIDVELKKIVHPLKDESESENENKDKKDYGFYIFQNGNKGKMIDSSGNMTWIKDSDLLKGAKKIVEKRG